MNSTPVLEGFGVRLEPLSLDHLPQLAATHDESTWTYMSESGATPELLRGFVERALAGVEAGTTQVWTTTLANPRRIVGCSRIADLNFTHKTGEIGWTWIAPDLRGTTLNATVKLLQLRHAFGSLGLRRVALKTHHGNLRSQRAMLKLGAQYEGTFRNHMIMPDGSSRDTKWYSIIDADWPVVEQGLLDRIHAGAASRNPEHHRT